MFEQLFGSKTRVKLLQLFYTNPNRSFYVREITRKVEEQINSVRRELSNLLSIGIITSDANNNRLYYEVNQDYEFFKPMTEIFGSIASEEVAAEEPVSDEKSDGKEKPKKAPTKPKPAASVEHPMAKELRGLGQVHLVVLTGQFTRDETSGVDVLLVGDLNQSKAAKFMSDLEKSENKELRYVILSTDNYKYRVQINDRFINDLLNSKKQIIINSQDLPV